MAPAARTTMQPSSEAKSLWLTVDQGNSRTKFVVWQGSPASLSEPIRLRGAEHTNGDLGLAELLADFIGGQLAGAGLSSVASSQAQDALMGAGLSALGVEVQRPSGGLVMGIRHPETLGADRMFAARGAVELAGGSTGGLVVVDAGTALTVDCVLDGVFLGGAIAPGPRLLAEALERGGAQLFATQPKPGAPALGRDSRGALEAGVVVGFRGAARALVHEQLADPVLAETPNARVFVTGGARAFLLQPTPFVELEITEAPDLVHRGLLAAMWSERES
ncbi:MAG: type III pantothenate kinase [Planctomycetota bacterium]|jgi:type III pantothenate kinase